MELNKQEKQSLLQLLDRVQVQGVQEAQAYISLVRKISDSLDDTEIVVDGE